MLEFRSYSWFRTQVAERPRCPNCGSNLWLRLVEPGDLPGFDRRTFECTECGDEEIMVFKFR